MIFPFGSSIAQPGRVAGPASGRFEQRVAEPENASPGAASGFFGELVVAKQREKWDQNAGFTKKNGEKCWVKHG